MIKQTFTIGLLILSLLALLLGSTQGSSPRTGVAQGNGYQIVASVIAGGGGSLQSGPYTLTGTIGQAEAAHLFLGSGQALSGGFWHGTVTGRRIYLPLTVKY